VTVLVTGGAGFIGSNFIKYLNSRGITDICVSDYLTNGKQYTNLGGCAYSDFVTPDAIDRTLLSHISKVYHFGAISSTTEWNGELVLERNYNYSVRLIAACVSLGIPISYSSSASVYGNDSGPLNLYAWSKWLVDKWVEGKIIGKHKGTVQGFRYFNVWGPGEWHKGGQASPYYQFNQQALEHGQIKIFEGSENCKRDFIHVDRVCEIQEAISNTDESGIWDLGTGAQKSFKDVAEEVAAITGAKIVEIPFPDTLKEHYQWSTRADMTWLINIINKYNLTISNK
jgi:ADP-L-glycero-D-manno-heptose 6-epimerase